MRRPVGIEMQRKLDMPRETNHPGLDREGKTVRESEIKCNIISSRCGAHARKAVFTDRRSRYCRCNTSTPIAAAMAAPGTNETIPSPPSSRVRTRDPPVERP